MLKRTLLVFALTLGVLSFNGNVAFAQSGETVAATVTIQSVSVTVDPTSINYGTMPFATTRQSTALTPSVTFTAENTGNITEDIIVKGTDATGDVGGTPFTWTLQSGPLGCPGTTVDTFRHSVTPAGDTAHFLTTSDDYLMLDLAAGNTRTFTTEFHTPCLGSVGAGATASTSIIVTAILATP